MADASHAAARTILDDQRAHPPPAARRCRYFFVGMAVLAVAVVAAAFVPEYQRFADGAFPIGIMLHVHAAIMAGWVAAFFAQTYLAATGRTARHRAIGPYTVGLGWIAWASMVFVEFRALAITPIPRTAGALDWDLPGPYIYLTFAIFLGWGTIERRRPDWHKRLMTFALFVSLAAALERYAWISMTYGFWPFAALIDIGLLVPLAAFDLRGPRSRLHPATLYGTALLLGLQAVMFALWGTAAWHGFALRVATMMHG